MKKQKEDITASLKILSNQEILIAYCSTLSDERAKKAYKMLREEFEIDRTKMVRLSHLGNVDDGGLIRMTRRQYEKMLKECGEYKFKWLVACVSEYIAYLKQQMDLGDSRAKKQYKLYTTNSIYPKLMKGWVMDRYNREAPPPPKHLDSASIDFYSIKSEEEAIEYIKSLPPCLVSASPELEFLAGKYPNVIKFMEDEMKG